MAEKVKVEWTARAVADLEAIHNYLITSWTQKEANRFLDLVQQFEIVVRHFPNSFPASRKKRKYRLGLIHPNVTAVYRVDSSRITIISLQDNRSKSVYR